MNEEIGKFAPPEHLKGRNDFSPAKNPSLKCPKHIVNSGSIWFCTRCGTDGYCQYEHGYNDMVAFISKHKDCKLDFGDVSTEGEN
jgi:hypothetical protein